MGKMAVIAHGGAGPGPERQENLQKAVDVATELLLAGASAIEAAVEACVVLEDDPVFNAGTGGVFRNDGSVLLDASIQTSDGRIGFVIAMSDTLVGGMFRIKKTFIKQSVWLPTTTF